MGKIKYIVNGIEFTSRQQIREYTTKIVNTYDNDYHSVSKDDIDFLLEIISNYPNLSNYNHRAFTVGLDYEYQKNLCIKLILKDDTKIDISYIKCINNIKPIGIIKEADELKPANTNKTVLKLSTTEINFKFRFGKYKGKTIEWVLQNDSDYIEWMLNNFNDTNGIVIPKIETYLSSIGVNIIFNEVEKPPIQYTKEDLEKAIQEENYELAAVINKQLIEDEDELPF